MNDEMADLRARLAESVPIAELEALAKGWETDTRRGIYASDRGWRGVSIGKGFDYCEDDLLAVIKARRVLASVAR